MCNMKTMLKVMFTLGLVAGIAYVALPQFQTSIASVAPLLLALACPLAMVLMAAGMNGSKEVRNVDGGKEGACGMVQARCNSDTKGDRHA